MKNWRKAVIHLPATIRDAAESLSNSSTQLVLVTTADNKLVGVINDGDIRRGLLNGESLESAVESIMVTTYTHAQEDDPSSVILATMREKEIRQIPILNEHDQVVGLKTLMDMTLPSRKTNWVVLMAGGQGQRLRPLTANCPKPLLSIGGRPLLETIIHQFIAHGFYRFYISVNYRAEMIQNHFGDGSNLGVEIRYIQETEQLGTAGAVGLLPEIPQEPIFVMNGDVLTSVDFPHMLNFHLEKQAQATMAVRNFTMQVPYGVVEVQDNAIISLKEKPVHHFFVNAGIYILSPASIERIPQNSYLDMPTLFEHIQNDNGLTTAFPIHEYWLDIGHKQDFDQANIDYQNLFE